MQYVRVRNQSREYLASIYNGQVVRFEPTGQTGCTRDLPPEVAEKVLRDLGDKVTVIEPGKAVDKTPAKFYGDAMWIANVSGDPDAPAKISVGTKENKVTGTLDEIFEPNMKASPQHVYEVLGQEEKLVNKGGMYFAVTKPVPPVELAPYERIRVPKDIGKTVLLRDRGRGFHAGLVIRAREPSVDDPTLDWDLERLNAYFTLIEPNALAFEIPTEAALREKFPGDSSFQLALHDAKFKMWSRCYLRAVNPQFNPPTKEDIDAFLRGNSVAPETSKVATKPVPAKSRAEELLDSLE